MESKVMQVFYGPDCLPYKDSARSVHYPIIGNSFLGASNTTQIRFYVRDIGGVNNVSWVAVSKLPNGQIGNQVLSSIQLDSELNEYYVALDLSSYYTQLKGDVYISLNGYQGGIQLIYDEETDIYNITGTPIIEATGAIKLAINYAPQLPLGKHFQIDDLQQILGLVSQKANIINTIQVVANITLEDLSYYSSGQLFYDLNSKTYYRYDGSTYQVVDTFGILANEKTLVRYNVLANTNLMSLYPLFLTRLVCVNFAGLDYLVQFGSASSFCAFKLSTREFFVPTVTPLTTFVNVIENQYKITYVEKKTNNNTVYAINSNGEQIMLPYSASVLYDALVLRTASGQVKVPSAPVSNDDATSKAYVDGIDQALRDLIDTIIRNAFILVDTTEYPTLVDFKDSTGQEGFIYLYPVDLSNPSLGYYQLIWENNDWLDLGTTQIDLSDYYTKEEIDDIHRTINNDVPKHQSTTILIVDPLTNINGRTFQTYTSQNVTIGGRPAVKILRSGNKLNEQQAKEYMEYMTGSYFLPKYNYDYPRNTYFIMPDGQLLKPQYDSTNGLLLYLSGQIATKSYTDTELAKKVDKTNSGEKVYGTDELGSQTTYDVDSDLVGSGAIVRRETGTGTVVVGAPTSNTHATTKQYVDNSIANVISNVTKQFNRNSANDNENTKGTLSFERVNDYTEYAGYWRAIDNTYLENSFVGTKVINYEEGYDYFYTGRNLGSANYYGIVYFDSANNVIGGECVSSSTQILYSRYKATIPLGTAKIGFTAIREGENQPLNGFLLIEKSKHLELSDDNYNNELGFSKKAVSKDAFYHIPMYGQSLSLGSDAPYYNDGTMNGLYMLGSIGAASGDLKPLELTSGEMQPLVPALQDLKKKWDLNGINHNIVATSSGSGGSSIAQLMSATRQAEIKTEQGYDYNIDNESPLPYVKWQNACSSTKVIIKDRFRMNLLCPAIIYLQGERDFLSDQELINAGASRPHAYACGDDKELYKTYMKRLKEDMQAYIMALYGQTIKPYFIIYTCSDIFIRTLKMGIVMAQQEFAEENDDVILLAPHYPMPNYTNGHLTTNGYRWYGEYIGKALGDLLVQNKVNRPMVARDFKIEGQVIKVKVHGATLPLKMDIELVQNISQKGFRVYVDGVEGTISSLLFYGDEIMLTVSQNLTTANKVELTYASSGVGGKGNIRDSYRYKGQYAYLDDTNDHGSSGNLTIAYSNLEEGTIYPLYNWLTPFYIKLKG